MYDTDTIAAISTAVSESGIGIIRISGPESIKIADRIFRSPKPDFSLENVPGYTMHYGFIYDEEQPVDEVLVSVFKAPRSYTAEDTVEINCHGGIYAMKRVMETVLKQGVRPASPGEFTKRAFLNGRIDLTRAQAVMDIITSKNEYALRGSLSTLKGSVYDQISSIRKEILYETARIESALDDPEHYELDEEYRAYLAEKTTSLIRKIHRMAETSDKGRMLQEGIKTVIIGSPNAGKSSLMNALVGEERAIVTRIEGTTRDILTETINLQGITLRIIDTAGIRHTEDEVEMIGVEKAKETLKEADLALFVMDRSVSYGENEIEIMRLLKDKKTIILLNKADLNEEISEDEINSIWKENTDSSHMPPVLSISAKEMSGIDKLEKIIIDLFSIGEVSFNDEIVITSIRQKQKLLDSERSLHRVMESLGLDLPEDFLTVDLMEAYETLGEITGENAGEDLINEIFDRFCMGK